jgi:hypothetical protein
MMACATLGYLLSLSQFTPIKPLKSKRQLWKICLLASIFCVTIVLGNLSLKYIPVSFNQAIGATTPFFTAIFAVLLQGAPEQHANTQPADSTSHERRSSSYQAGLRLCLRSVAVMVANKLAGHCSHHVVGNKVVLQQAYMRGRLQWLTGLPAECAEV